MKVIFDLLLNVPFNLAVSALCIMTYLVNFFVFKLKREYRGFRHQIFLILLLPYFNVIFLIFNVMIFAAYGTGYKVIKTKKSKKSNSKRKVPVRV